MSVQGYGSRMRILKAQTVALVALLVGCGNDNNSVVDAAPADASFDADTTPDAFTPCPGQAPFEGGFRSWADDANLASISFTDAESSRNALSAPNGRIIVCLDRGGENRLFTDGVSYLQLSHHTIADDSEKLYWQAGTVYLHLPTPAEGDAFYSDHVKVPRDTDLTTLIVSALSLTNGDPISEAAISPTVGHDGSFRMVGGLPAAGSTTGSDGRLLYANVPAGSPIELNIPAGCTVPTEITPQVGGITSVLVACE
jgi:hypothetical protein